MSVRFVDVDRDTPLLFPVDLREWSPENHLVHFIIEAVEKLDMSGFKVNETGSGSRQYPPEMMVALLLYCYATGRMSSRVTGEATHTDVAVRFICGNRAHPDHTVICRFRTENREGFKELFAKAQGKSAADGVFEERREYQRGRDEDTREREQAQGGELRTGGEDDSGGGKGGEAG
jgi:transposase